MIVDLPLWLWLLPLLLAVFGVGLMTLLVIFLSRIIARLLCAHFRRFHRGNVVVLPYGIQLKLIAFATLIAIVVVAPASADEHRSRAVAREFQREHPCPLTGLTTGACPGYWRDHVVPLACHGPDSVENMQWQTIADAKAKDAWERRGCVR